MGCRRSSASGRVWAFVVVTFQLLSLLGSGTAAMQAERAPRPEGRSFEVASVRLNTAGGFSLVGVQARPDGIIAENVSLRRLIAFAYGLKGYQHIEGGTQLLDDNFDVWVKASVEVPDVRDGEIGPRNIMMQDLLADRFKLAVRWEDRRQAGYALERLDPNAPVGPGMRQSDVECPQPADTRLEVSAEMRRCRFGVIGNDLRSVGRPLSEVARLLSLLLQRPVIDRTGLLGPFDVTMTFDVLELPPFAQARPPSDLSGGRRSNLPSLVTAIREQLGLRLDRQTLNVPVLVVERVERPPEN